MKHQSEKLILETERNKSEEDRKILKSTEGFSQLTPKQQTLINQSLYLQARAERGVDEATATAIVSPKTHATKVTEILPQQYLQEMYEMYKGEGYNPPNPADSKYIRSQEHIANWYCHASIANLEEERGLSVEAIEIPEEFFKTKYEAIRNYSDLKETVESCGFPCVLHIASEPDKYNRDNWTHKHSCLILGHDRKGDFVVWEKMGFKLPYRIVALKDVYEQYKNEYFWGVRKLKSKKYKNN